MVQSSFTADAVLVGVFTADAVLSRGHFTLDADLFRTMPHAFTGDGFLVSLTKGSFFTADAYIHGHTFTLDAWLAGTRSRHDRTLDHQGVEDDTTMVVSASFGRYVAGMTVHAVLLDMANRIISLEGSNKGVNQFTANAFIAWYFRADAVFRLEADSSFTADAELVSGGTFTADATIAGHNEFGIIARAFLV